MNRIGSENRPGLGRGPVIHQGGNGGYQAMNLAYLWGARAIVLLGMDCGAPVGEPTHWFGDHTGKLGNPVPAAFESWRKNFILLANDLAADGIRVINCSRKTTLECFERMPLEDAQRALSGAQ